MTAHAKAAVDQVSAHLRDLTPGQQLALIDRLFFVVAQQAELLALLPPSPLVRTFADSLGMTVAIGGVAVQHLSATVPMDQGDTELEALLAVLDVLKNARAS